MMRSPLSCAAMRAATTAMLLLLAIAPASRSALGSPLRAGDKERLQEQEQEQDHQPYYGYEEEYDAESGATSVAENLADLGPLGGDDYGPEDDDDNADSEQLPTHSGDGPVLFGNSSQEARSAELALFVEHLARLVREMGAPNSSLSRSEALSRSNARAADKRLRADDFFRHFFGISSSGGSGRGNDTDDGVGHLEADVDASAPADAGRGVALRSAAVYVLDTLLGADINQDDSLFSEP